MPSYNGYVPGVGGYHLSLANPPRVVPAHEKHRWDRKIGRGEVATCTKCGTQKCFRRDFNIVFRLANTTAVLTQRPACTGKKGGTENA